MNAPLSGSHGYFEELVRASNAAITGVDLQRRIQSWNRGAEEVFGYSAAEALGADLLLLVPEARRDEALANHERVSAGKTFATECVWRHKSGREVEVALSLSPMRDAHGEIVGSCCVAQISERKYLERGMIEAAERESRRIGQELHDHLCQLLVGAAFSVKAVANGLPPGSEAALEMADLARLINSAGAQAREIARGLNPVELDAAGLIAALQELTRQPRAGIVCRLESARVIPLPDAQTALHLYRIAQEAVANAATHARATEIVVRFAEEGAHVVIEIRDNGRGFVLPEAPHGFGLETMKCRARAIGAGFCVDTRIGAGTRVRCVLTRKK